MLYRDDLTVLLQIRRDLAPLAHIYERFCPHGADDHHVIARVGDVEITCGSLRAVAAVRASMGARLDTLAGLVVPALVNDSLEDSEVA